MVGVGRDVKDHQVPTALQQARLPIAISSHTSESQKLEKQKM